MPKFILSIIFGIYALIAAGHGLFFVAEAKYHCVKQIGFIQGIFVGCDKFYVDPINRVLKDSFFKNFYRGLIWPAYYFSDHSGSEKTLNLWKKKQFIYRII